MIGKVISVILISAMLIFSLVFMYQNLPQEPIEMERGSILPEHIAIIAYGTTPVFGENLRFNHNHISYFIEEKCAEVREDVMIEAFNIFENEMSLISFYRVKDKVEADINIGCSDNYIELGENLFVAGEGGPSRIINTSVFKIIEKGKISLYNDPQCNYPIVELHELLHVFGFDHSNNPSSIMYNVSRCDQRITDDMIELIDKLYSIEPLADALISELTAVKKGKYLDFNITILNEGLIGIDSINLSVVANDKEVQLVDLGELDIGYGRTLKVTNVKLPSINVERIDFIIDIEDNIRELNEENNFIQMVISA